MDNYVIILMIYAAALHGVFFVLLISPL